MIKKKLFMTSTSKRKNLHQLTTLGIMGTQLRAPINTPVPYCRDVRKGRGLLHVNHDAERTAVRPIAVEISVRPLKLCLQIDTSN